MASQGNAVRLFVQDESGVQDWAAVIIAVFEGSAAASDFTVGVTRTGAAIGARVDLQAPVKLS